MNLVTNLSFIKKFKDAKISNKINIAFLGIIVLFILVLITNIYLIQNIQTTKTFLTDSYGTQKTISEISKYISTVKQVQNDVITIGNSSNSSSLFTQSNNNVNRLLIELKGYDNVFSETQMSLVGEFEKKSKLYNDLFYSSTLKIGKMLSHGPITDVKADTERISTRKLIATYNEQLDSMIDTLNDYSAEKIDTYNNLLNRQFTNLIIIFAVAIVAAIAFTIFFSKLLTNSILSNIKILNNSTRLLGEGNLNLSFNMTSNDEVGLLGNTFEKTVNNLRNIIQSISEFSNMIFSSSDNVRIFNEKTQKSIQVSTELMNSITDSTHTQQANIEEIYASTSNISSNIEEIVQNVNSLEEYANQTNTVTNSSVEDLHQTIKQVNHVNREIHNTASLIQKLQNKSKNIESIADVISSIASQTNLLSLNASIEAARAGEQGKGFTVVANEIRKLSNEVSQSSKGILELVNDINGLISVVNANVDKNNIESEKGINLISKVEDSFVSINSDINQQLFKISRLSDSINAVSEGFNNIIIALNEIVSSSETIAASTLNSSNVMNDQLKMADGLIDSSNQLSSVAIELQSLVNKFKI